VDGLAGETGSDQRPRGADVGQVHLEAVQGNLGAAPSTPGDDDRLQAVVYGSGEGRAGAGSDRARGVVEGAIQIDGQ